MIQAAVFAEKVAAFKHPKLSAVRLAGDLSKDSTDGGASRGVENERLDHRELNHRARLAFRGLRRDGPTRPLLCPAEALARFSAEDYPRRGHWLWRMAVRARLAADNVPAEAPARASVGAPALTEPAGAVTAPGLRRGGPPAAVAHVQPASGRQESVGLHSMRSAGCLEQPPHGVRS
jgi:hypothetical protein